MKSDKSWCQKQKKDERVTKVLKAHIWSPSRSRLPKKSQKSTSFVTAISRNVRTDVYNLATSLSTSCVVHARPKRRGKRVRSVTLRHLPRSPYKIYWFLGAFEKEKPSITWRRLEEVLPQPKAKAHWLHVESRWGGNPEAAKVKRLKRSGRTLIKRSTYQISHTHHDAHAFNVSLNEKFHSHCCLLPS